MLFRISSRHFVAGGELSDDNVVKVSAPIIGYMQRDKWSLERVEEYCIKKNWVLMMYQDKVE